MTNRRTLLLLTGLLLAGGLAEDAAGQQYRQRPGVYQPLNQRSLPGKAAHWLMATRRPTPGYFQPVRFELPSDGRVTVFDHRGRPAAEDEAPAQVALAVGHVYRLGLSEMPEIPGVELFPSVELIDHLHPPRGMADRFPIVVPLSKAELEDAADGRMVTKVIYLEQPQLADTVQEGVPVTRLAPNRNALAEADYRGRPMLIVRVGGRLPPIRRRGDRFYGDGPGVRPSTPPATPQPPQPDAAQDPANDDAARPTRP